MSTHWLPFWLVHQRPYPSPAAPFSNGQLLCWLLVLLVISKWGHTVRGLCWLLFSHAVSLRTVANICPNNTSPSRISALEWSFSFFPFFPTWNWGWMLFSSWDIWLLAVARTIRICLHKCIEFMYIRICLHKCIEFMYIRSHLLSILHEIVNVLPPSDAHRNLSFQPIFFFSFWLPSFSERPIHEVPELHTRRNFHRPADWG